MFRSPKEVLTIASSQTRKPTQASTTRLQESLSTFIYLINKGIHKKSVCAMHKIACYHNRGLASLFIDIHELQAPPHYPPFSGPSGVLPLTHDPMFSGHSGALPLTHDPMFPGLSGMESTPVMLPRFASHEAATSPISWLSTWQSQLPVLLRQLLT